MFKIGTVTILVISLALFFLWSFLGNTRVEKNEPVNILENSLVTWHKGWKKEQGFYRSLISGSEFEFSFNNTQKISFNLETEYKNPTVGLEGWLDDQHFVFSFPDLSPEKTTLDISNKEHLLKARAFCFTIPSLPCDLKIRSITLDPEATVLHVDGQEEKTLGVLGDSITGRYGNGNYIFLLANKMNYRLINSSYAGSVMFEEGVSRMNKEIIPYQPDLVVVFLGTNDLANNVPVSSFIRDYEEAVSQVKHNLPKTKIVVVGLLPRVDFSKEQIAEFSKIIQDIADRMGIFYLDPYLWLEAGDFADGLHPSKEVQTEMAEYFYSALLKMNLIDR